MHSFDPEHLICNGAGGAFMHPTHVFAPAAFTPCQVRGAVLPLSQHKVMWHVSCHLTGVCRKPPGHGHIQNPSQALQQGAGEALARLPNPRLPVCHSQ